MTTEEAMSALHTDEDFVYAPRHNHSMKKIIDRYPDGAPDRVIAQALMVTVEDVERIYQDIVSRLRERIADPQL